MKDRLKITKISAFDFDGTLLDFDDIYYKISYGKEIRLHL